jgi:carbon storage regulator CsrA
MLKLTRKPDERIQIGDDIFITIKRVRSNGSVLIGVEAPDDLPIRRLPKGGMDTPPSVECAQDADQ